MNLNDEKLKVMLNNLYIELCKKDSNPKLILAKAVSLGMKYQEEKIKEGIKVVFDNLNLSH